MNAIRSFVIAVTTLILVTSGSSAADLQTIRISMAAKTMTYAPYLVAMDKGYYEQEGLKLDITLAGGGVATPAQLSGQIDINTSGPVALTPILRGAPLKIVYTIANHSNFQLWSTSKSIKTLRDLKGKQIAVNTRGDLFEIATKLALLRAGLPLDWVNYTAINSGGATEQVFASKALPGVVMTLYDVAAAKQQNVLNQGVLVSNMFRDIPMPYSGVAVTDAYIKDHADALRAFIRATIKGMRYMKKYKAQTLSIVARYQTQPDHDASEHYDQLMQTFTKDGTIANDVAREDMFVRASVLEIPRDQVPPLDKAYNYDFVHTANADLDKMHWTPQP